MDLTSRIEQILKITNWSSKTESPEVAKLRSVYFDVFGKRLKINCGNCVQTAYYELKELYDNKQTLQQMTNGKFKIKVGANGKSKMIQLHGHPEVLTNANLTDEKALKLLKRCPGHIASFEVYPENWRELADGVTEEAIETVAKTELSEEETKALEHEKAINERKEQLQELGDDELKEICKGATYPEDEYKKLKGKKLINYIIGKEFDNL